MALNIFDKYGIKEVANVYFQALSDDPRLDVKKDDIVLYLDTLKVSTIETTAEQVDAQGGWGNPKLITWDYGKEVTITLEDALISMESLAFMYGGAIKDSSKENSKVQIHRSAEGTFDGKTGKFLYFYDGATKEKLSDEEADEKFGRLYNFVAGEADEDAEDGAEAGASNIDIQWMNFSQGTRGHFNASAENLTLEMINAGITEVKAGDRVRIFWVEERDEEDEKSAVEVNISSNTFPGTYRVVGDTFIRSQVDGSDSAYQFVINKAKVSSEVTLTLEAEGDPSTFEMTLTALRDDDQNMFSLIKY